MLIYFINTVIFYGFAALCMNQIILKFRILTIMSQITRYIYSVMFCYNLIPIEKVFQFLQSMCARELNAYLLLYYFTAQY